MFTPEVHPIQDPASGLDAWIVLDDTTLGPAAGGIRTFAYPDAEAARAEALRLARAMTYKCALAGLPAGGGKGVVRLHPGLDRPAAFRHLGAFVESLGGRYHCAGDLGTTAADLAALAEATQWVHTDTETLAEATGRGVLRAMEACVRLTGRPALSGLKVVVQGCGDMGAAVARAVRGAGARLCLADRIPERARALAEALGGEVVDAEACYDVEADVFAPCAVGGVLTHETVRRLRVFAVCGAANEVLAEAAVEAELLDRGILYVPDFVASAGAVISGLGRRLMERTDPGSLIDRIGETTTTLLQVARADGRLPSEVARRRAEARIARARARGG